MGRGRALGETVTLTVPEREGEDDALCVTLTVPECEGEAETLCVTLPDIVREFVTVPEQLPTPS